MNTSIRFLLWVLSNAAFVLASFAEPRLIGVSAPLSGGGSGWGSDLQKVLAFANNKITGGRYSFVFEDDRCDTKSALLVAKKLVSINHVKEVFSVCGQTVLATADYYNKSGVTVFAPLATPSRISELGVIRTALSDSLAVVKLAEVISKHHQSVAILTEENDYPVSFYNDFARTAKSLNLVITNQTYLPHQRDFRVELARLKSMNVEALFLNTQTEENLATLLKQMKEIKFSPKVYGAYMPGSAKFLQLAGSLANELIFVDFPNIDELLNEGGKALYQEYLAENGPLQGWSFIFPATIEALRALDSAITSGSSINEHLMSRSFDGIFGPYSFSDRGDIVGPHHVLRVIRDGKAVLLEP